MQVTKFVTNASSATWWPKLEPMLIALHVGQISLSQDYFKLLSVRKLIQVEMLYPGSVFPFDRERWDTLSNLVTVVLLNIYLSQRSRSKGTLRKLDFRESQILNL